MTLADVSPVMPPDSPGAPCDSRPVREVSTETARTRRAPATAAGGPA